MFCSLLSLSLSLQDRQHYSIEMSFKVTGYIKDLGDSLNNPVFKIDLVSKNGISNDVTSVFDIAAYGKVFERNQDWTNLK